MQESGRTRIRAETCRPVSNERRAKILDCKGEINIHSSLAVRFLDGLLSWGPSFVMTVT